MPGTPIAIRPWRPKKPHLQPRRRARAVLRAEAPHGVIWTQTAAGTTSPTRDMSGRLSQLQVPDGTPTDAATGCGIRALVTCSYRAITGDSCPTPAVPGASSTISVGVGARAWAAATPGGIHLATIPDHGSEGHFLRAIECRTGQSRRPAGRLPDIPFL